MITVANFDEKDTYKTVSGLWQWDYGQNLRIQGLSLPPAVEIHFSLQQSGGEAVTRIGITKDGVTDVTIPDSMLENDGKSVDYYIYAFVYISNAQSGQTEYRISMSVKSRPKPEAWSGSGETTMGQIMEAINQIAAGKADRLEYKDNILKLLSGEKELDRVTITGGSGENAREIELQKGDASIQWRYVGDAEWTDLISLDEITGQDGADGKDGADGQPGQDGAPGADGADGKSAYQYAQEGGYTGTEEEFAVLIGKQIQQNKENISKLSEDLNDCENRISAIENGVGNGGSASVTGLKSILTDMVTFLKSVPFDDTTASASDLDAIQNKIDNLSESEGGEDTPSQPVLNSISATYSGGNVLAGTSPSALTGIIVTGHYSDGNRTVTGWTINGTIAEGSNILTISYGGKTTTITVVGYVEQSEPTAIEMMPIVESSSSDKATFYLEDIGSEKVTVTGSSVVNPSNRYFSRSVNPFTESTRVRCTLTVNKQTYTAFAIMGTNTWDGESKLAANKFIDNEWQLVSDEVFTYFKENPSPSWITSGSVAIETTVKAGDHLVFATRMPDNGIEKFTFEVI